MARNLVWDVSTWVDLEVPVGHDLDNPSLPENHLCHGYSGIQHVWPYPARTLQGRMVWKKKVVKFQAHGMEVFARVLEHWVQVEAKLIATEASCRLIAL